MPYVASDVEKLDQTELVGSHSCVALVQHYTKAPNTALWKEGKPVRGDLLIAKGTVIATFVDKKYPNKSHGNHAALYVSQGAGGVWVIDQWKGDPKKPKVSKRLLRFKGKTAGGRYVSPSNNGDAFSVVE